jgi:UDP-glucose 4-epimerase
MQKDSNEASGASVVWHSAGVGNTTESVNDPGKYCLKNIESWYFFIIFFLKRKKEGFWEGYGSFF